MCDGWRPERGGMATGRQEARRLRDLIADDVGNSSCQFRVTKYESTREEE